MGYEDEGFQAIAAKAKTSAPAKASKEERQLLSDLGAFGLNAFVVGLGARVLSRHHDAGRDIMKLGAVLAVAGFGVRAVVDGGLPKSLS